jgi:polyisoprenyl-phosphate glycosyltransferase
LKIKFISIIIPVFNEEENVLRAHEKIVEELKKRDDIEFEIIFTDNHSIDRTFEILEHLSSIDSRVKVIRFSRNFGFNRSILAGYRHAIGDAAIQIDCDLEDPPRLFHDFLDLWMKGHDVVFGMRSNRQENWLVALLRKIFFRLLNKISTSYHEADAGDFRLIDRKILDQLLVIDDAEPFVRGLIAELSINEIGVKYSRNRREFGTSKFPLSNLISFALDAVYAHSIIPLRIATYVGIFVALITSMISGAYIVGRIISPENWPAGFATTTVLILFGISLNALFLGIIGEYIARIHIQVRRRPSVIIEKTINIDLDQYTEERLRNAL